MGVGERSGEGQEGIYSSRLVNNTSKHIFLKQLKNMQKELTASAAEILANISSSQTRRGLNSYRKCILVSEGGSGRDMCHSSSSI